MKAISGAFRVVVSAGFVLLFFGVKNAFPQVAGSWSFDSTSDTVIFDGCGNGNTGFMHNASLVPGVKGNAVSFSGSTTSYVRVMNSASLNMPDKLSIECWVYARQITPLLLDGQTIIRKENCYAFGIGSQGKIGFWIHDATSAWQGSWTFSQQSLQAFTWYHVVGVWNGQSMKVYINGVQDPDTMAAHYTIASNTNNVYMGTFYNSSTEPLNGIVDELKLYHYALSPDTILAHYNAQKPVAPGPVTLITPADNATRISITPNLTWNSGSGGAPSLYYLRVATSNPFSALAVNDSTISASYSIITPLANSTKYYWEVASSNAAGESGWKVDSFTTVPPPPAAPTLLSPANSAIINKLPLALTWGTLSGATNYRVQISTSSSFTSLYVDDSTLTSANRSISSIGANSIYYWRVCAKNAGGWGAWCAAWAFAVTTGIIPKTPEYSAGGSHLNGVLEVYASNGTRVIENTWDATMPKAQLLKTATRQLANGFYTYRIRAGATLIWAGSMIKK